MTLTVPASVVAALVGAGTAAVTNFVFRWLERREEKRRQVRAAAIQAGIEAWKAMLPAMQRRSHEEPITLPHVFIGDMIRMMEIAYDTGLSADDAKVKLDAIVRRMYWL